MAEPILVASELRKSYREDSREIPVLKGIDLTVDAGEFLAILGPSGSGKSTFLHVIGLMDAPTSGSVRLLGSDTGRLNEDGRAALRNRHLGFIFQFDSLLHEFTVLENVTLPARIALTGRLDLDSASSRARELLTRFGMGALLQRLPRQLSGGERQRAAIARALLNRPSLILADEPTGNLDRRNGELVFSTLKDVAGQFGVAVVMVTHNESAVQFASRVLHLSDGSLVEGARTA